MTPEELEFVKLMNRNYERLLDERPIKPCSRWLLMLCIVAGFLLGVVMI